VGIKDERAIYGSRNGNQFWPRTGSATRKMGAGKALFLSGVGGV